MPREARRTTTSRSGPALVDSTDAAAALLDEAGRFVHWNAAFEALTGYRRELPPPAWPEFVLAETPPATIARLQIALSTRTLFFGDLLCRRSPDRPVWCDVSLTPVPTAEGDDLVMLVMLRDSSARRIAESVLSGPETQDRFVLDRIQSGIVVHDAATRILYANNKASELLGITYDRLLGVGTADPRWEFLDEEARPLPIEQFPVSRVLITGESVKGMLVGTRRPSDGRLTWGLCDAFPVRDVHGELVEIVVSFTDVTAIKEAELARSRSEARLQLVFEATNDAIWELDLASNTAWCSARFWQMLGYPVNDGPVASEQWMTLVSPDDWPGHERRMNEFLAQGRRTYETEVRMRHRAGHEVLTLVRGIIRRDEQGHPVRITGATTDITARHAMENRLRQSQKLESVGQLAGGVAHDFNNLLAIISGNLELLAESSVGNADADAAQLLREAREAASRGAGLTRRLLAFSRQQPLRLTVLHLPSLLAASAGMLRRLLPESVEIVVTESAELPAIRADAGLLENALLNLAINARDAMQERGRLGIAVDVVASPDPVIGDLPPGTYVRLRVSDTGCGMSREVVERAVEPFFTTKAVGQGTGLGLSMVYGFVRQCGGGLHLQSHEGEGTVVSLFFPAVTDTAGSGEHPTIPAASPTRAMREEVVLVVEDDPSVRALCVRELSSLGFRTVEAKDGPSALEVFAAASRVDLLLTDVVMPGGMNGTDVATALLARNPALPVVFMSGYHADILSDIISDEATHLLAKPFSMAELATLLDEVLPRRGD